MKRDKKAVLSLLAGAGLITAAASRKGSSAKLTTMGAETTWRKESQTYQQKNLILLTIREAVQNSLDAVRVAINEGKVKPADAFISVYVDVPQRVVTVDDTGIGMDVDRAMKFLTMHGTDKGDVSGQTAAGGWGVAKAVIYSLSETIRASLRTQDLFIPVEGFADYGDSDTESYTAGLPYLQGTRLTIYDVQPDQLPMGGSPDDVAATFENHSSHLFAGSWMGYSRASFATMLKLLLGSVGTDVPVYLVFTPPTAQEIMAVTSIPRPPSNNEVPKIFSPAGMTRINPTDGRKSRKKSVDELWSESGSYLRTKLYFGDASQFGKSALGKSLGWYLQNERSVLVCVRLNEMFMFYQTENVSSKGMQGKLILYDIYTNIRPYQEEVYPVSKTRENLTGRAKTVLNQLISAMNQEAVSAGADYEATVIQASNLEGLEDFQEEMVKELFRRAGIRAKKKEKAKIQDLSDNIMENLEEGRKKIGDVLEKSTNWRMQDYRKKTDIRTSGSSPLHGTGERTLLPNIAPLTAAMGEIYVEGLGEVAIRRYYSGLIKQSALLTMLNTLEEIRTLYVTYGSTVHANYMRHVVKAVEIRVCGGRSVYFNNANPPPTTDEVWGLFVDKHRGGGYQATIPLGDLQVSSNAYPPDLMPPLHLVLMDVRDVLALRSEELDEAHISTVMKRKQLINRLGILIAALSNPQGFAAVWDNYLMDAAHNPQNPLNWEENVRVVGFASDPSPAWGFDRSDLSVRSFHDFLSYSAQLDHAESYFYGMGVPGFWWPKLQLTEVFFGGEDQQAPLDWTKTRKRIAYKMLSIVTLSRGFSDLVEQTNISAGYDLIGAPTRIKKPAFDHLLEGTAGRRGDFITDKHISFEYDEQGMRHITKAKPVFALRTTYLGCQLVTMLQGMTDIEGKRAYPRQFIEPDRTGNAGWEHGFTLGFVTYFYDRAKTKAVARFAVAYGQGRKKHWRDPDKRIEAQAMSKKIQQIRGDMRAIFKNIPKRIKDEQELPLEPRFNPFDGFGMVRFGSEMSPRRIRDVEKRSLSYLPLLCCWSSLIGMVNAISGLKLRITCGLAFDTTRPGQKGDYLALAQSFGKSGIIFLRANRFTGVIENAREQNQSVDDIGTRLFSIAVHEFCHIPIESGHSQDYAYLRDEILEKSLPYLPFILELVAEQLDLNPPKQSARISQLQAKVAIRQAELAQMRNKKDE